MRFKLLVALILGFAPAFAMAGPRYGHGFYSGGHGGWDRSGSWDRGGWGHSRSGFSVSLGFSGGYYDNGNRAYYSNYDYCAPSYYTQTYYAPTYYAPANYSPSYYAPTYYAPAPVYYAPPAVVYREAPVVSYYYARPHSSYYYGNSVRFYYRH